MDNDTGVIELSRSWKMLEYLSQYLYQAILRYGTGHAWKSWVQDWRCNEFSFRGRVSDSHKYPYASRLQILNGYTGMVDVYTQRRHGE